MQFQGVHMSMGRNYRAYILDNPGYFYEAGYKGIRASQSVQFLHCHRMLYNGKTQLLYHLEDYYTLHQAAQTLGGNAFATVVVKILDGYLEMQNISFIHMESVDLDINSIYLDIENLQPYFIYLPLNLTSNREYIYKAGENLRRQIIGELKGVKRLQGGIMDGVLHELENPRNTIENLKDRILLHLGNYRESSAPGHYEILYADQAQTETQQYAETSILQENYQVQIALISKDQSTQILIDRPDMRLGHRKEDCDYCINNSNISRLHCRIRNINGRNYIIDENSTNGTYVNGIRIQSQQTVEISPGDRITLADLELTVTNVSGGETIR